MDAVSNSIKDRYASMSGATFTGSDTTHDISPIFNHLFCMKRAFFAGDSLHNKASVFIDKNTHRFHYYRYPRRSKTKVQSPKVKIVTNRLSPNLRRLLNQFKPLTVLRYFHYPAI